MQRKICLQLLAAFLAIGFITACQRSSLEFSPSIAINTKNEPGSTHIQPIVKQIISPTEKSIIFESWKNSPHSSTYDLRKGPNTYCARCHSPLNWNPSSKIDEPPNCVSCKFDNETSPRIAMSNPLVPESDWQNIGCDICHSNQNDSLHISWFNAVTGDHETVDSTTELCEKCHRDTEILRHKRNLGKKVHSDFVCTDCHDPHSTSATCSDAACHASVLLNSPFILGHDAVHREIRCAACHDTSGLEVEPIKDGDFWTPFRITELLGKSIKEPYQSHNLERDVDCKRCHYAKNPWGLEEL